jgi:hypothetical protein
MSVRPRLEEMHPSQLGVTAKTFANHRANVRAALELGRVPLGGVAEAKQAAREARSP